MNIVSGKDFARDLEWHSAFLEALGMEYGIPTVPNPKALKALVAEIRAKAREAALKEPRGRPNY